MYSEHERLILLPCNMWNFPFHFADQHQKFSQSNLEPKFVFFFQPKQNLPAHFQIVQYFPVVLHLVSL